MDFLDPRRKKAHKHRLFIGYALMAILVAIGTVAVLYLAYGFDIDRKTGSLIQNGIVFVDSKPNGAKVFLNEVGQRNNTATRMVLPAGTYNIRIERADYRHWERTFSLEGGEIERLVYPLLIPNELVTTDVNQYQLFPGISTQSPDRRWLFVQKTETTYQFDVYDLQDPEKEPANFIVPAAVLTSPETPSTLEFVEWSTDNRHVVFERKFGEKSEFLVLDREKPNESININKTFGINPVVVSLRNKHFDQIYYLDAVPGVMRLANLSNKTISTPILEQVIDYKSYGDDIVLYVTKKDVETSKAEFRILENDKTYALKKVNESDNYIMDVSKYDDKWYYVVGSSADTYSSVYENPLPSIKGDSKTPLVVLALMRIDNPRFVSFSANTQFIGIQSGSQLLTLDLEVNEQYRTNLGQNIPLDYKIKWMDGHRYIYTANQQSYIIDFDGSNEQTLVTSRAADGPFFDRDYDNVFTFEESKNDGAKKAMTMTVIHER